MRFQYWEYKVDAFYRARPSVQVFGTTHACWSSAWAEYLAAKSRDDIGRIVVSHYGTGQIIDDVTAAGPRKAS